MVLFFGGVNIIKTLITWDLSYINPLNNKKPPADKLKTRVKIIQQLVGSSEEAS